MRKVLGVLMIAIGILGGVVADIIFFFVGGIEQIIRGFQATPINGGDVTWGFVRAIPLNGVCLVVGIIFLTIPGIALLASRPSKKQVKARRVYSRAQR